MNMDFKNTVPKLNPTASLENVKISPEDAFVLSRVNGQSTLEEIRNIVGFTEEKLTEVIKGLMTMELIVMSEREITRERIAHDKKISNKIQRRIREKYEHAVNRDFYRLLEVVRGATEKQIEKNYFKLSKEFHPDRFFKEELGPFQKMLEEVFDSIQQAHETLTDPDLKKQYFDQKRARKIKAEPPPEPPKKPGRDMSKVKAEVSSAEDQYKMGCKEEERGNLKAALNFFKMAMMFDPKNETYHEALNRVKEALKNPLKSL